MVNEKRKYSTKKYPSNNKNLMALSRSGNIFKLFSKLLDA